MTGRAVSIELLWDVPIPATLERTQGWVLCAMQQHGRGLVNMLWRILGNEQDVCDAYQDTFLKLANHEHGCKPEHVKAYVFRSASNIAISILRHKLVEKNNPPPVITTQNNTNSPASELDTRYLTETLRAGIAELPDHFRDVVTLHDLGDLPYEQVAKIMGITAATARVYRCRAVQLLAARMRKETR
ncbi:MAG: sigma-70 family RNA polymerase sigma factor [Sedimentisphaerales bacterium]|jgi:RNA polymerase sigma-70 factor (ECF subfamily)